MRPSERGLWSIGDHEFRGGPQGIRSAVSVARAIAELQADLKLARSQMRLYRRHPGGAPILKGDIGQIGLGTESPQGTRGRPAEEVTRFQGAIVLDVSLQAAEAEGIAEKVMIAQVQLHGRDRRAGRNGGEIEGHKPLIAMIQLIVADIGVGVERGRGRENSPRSRGSRQGGRHRHPQDQGG